MNEQPEEQPALMPLKNFRRVGPLTPEQEEWWLAFGRHLAEHRKRYEE